MYFKIILEWTSAYSWSLISRCLFLPFQLVSWVIQSLYYLSDLLSKSRAVFHQISLIPNSNMIK